MCVYVCVWSERVNEREKRDSTHTHTNTHLHTHTPIATHTAHTNARARTHTHRFTDISARISVSPAQEPRLHNLLMFSGPFSFLLSLFAVCERFRCSPSHPQDTICDSRPCCRHITLGPVAHTHSLSRPPLALTLSQSDLDPCSQTFHRTHTQPHTHAYTHTYTYTHTRLYTDTHTHTRYTNLFCWFSLSLSPLLSPLLGHHGGRGGGPAVLWSPHWRLAALQQPLKGGGTHLFRRAPQRGAFRQRRQR